MGVTHELFDFVFPFVPEKTIGWRKALQPMWSRSRARAGLIQPEQVWADLVRRLPQGLPAAGDQGLDVTHTWGRTYWRGALFCLLADIDI